MRADDRNLAAQTRQRESRIVHVLLIPRFGALSMHQLTAQHIEQTCREMRGPYKPSTIACCIRTLRAVVRSAIEQGWYVGPDPLAAPPATRAEEPEQAGSKRRAIGGQRGGAA
jgi:hypothetical protein